VVTEERVVFTPVAVSTPGGFNRREIRVKKRDK
jgi:hypothetical protein